jgi:hypothetical protein
VSKSIKTTESIKYPDPIYKKPDDDIALWIVGKLERGVDESKYETKYTLGDVSYKPKEYWAYEIMKPSVIRPEDPFGEENYGESAPFNIRIEKYEYSYEKYTYYYNLKLNNESLDVSEKLIIKIIDLLEAPLNKRTSENSLKIKNEEKARKDKIRKELF